MKGNQAGLVMFLLALFSSVSVFAASEYSLQAQPLLAQVQSGLSKTQSGLSKNQSSLVQLQRLKNATLEHSESKLVQRYLLPLGAMRKINGKWRSKKHDILSGDLTRTTYLLKDDESFEELRNLDGSISLSELYQYYSQQLANQSAEMLFECTGRNCGSSNQWGNGFVDNKRMVGRDRNQAYLAAKIANDNVISFVAIYMVKNVTGETRVHLDRLSIESSSTPVKNNEQMSSTDSAYKNSGRILIITASELNQSETLERLTQVLQTLPQSKGKENTSLYLVGHAYSDASVESLKQTSLGYAKQLKQVLSDLEANFVGNIFLEGVGPLAPAGEGEDQLDRVELIFH